jgi:hypothetical protein
MIYQLIAYDPFPNFINLYSDTVLFTDYGIKTMDDSQKIKTVSPGGKRCPKGDEGVLIDSPPSSFLPRSLRLAERCPMGRKCEQIPF